MKRTRTEITVEVDELIQVTADHKQLVQAWCSACGAEATMVTPQQAAVITGVTVRAVNRWVESDVVHFVEPDGRLLMLCLNSLRQIVLPDD